MTFKKGQIAWNKDLTIEDPRVKKYCRKNKVWDNQEEVVKLYKKELLNPQEIAKIYRCSSQPIKNILKKNNAFVGISERRKILAKAGKLKIWNLGLNKENDSRVKDNIEKMTLWKQNNVYNKTYEQIYGDEKTKLIKEKMSVSNSVAKQGEKNPMFGRKQTEKWLEMRKNLILPFKDSKPELKIQDFSKQLNIEFFTHYWVNEITHAYQCDILIYPQPNFMCEKKTIIEVDGDWWHGNPIRFPIPNQMQKEQIEEDACRNEELRAAGFNVIRLWETDIKKMSLDSFKAILNINKKEIIN